MERRYATWESTGRSITTAIGRWVMHRAAPVNSSRISARAPGHHHKGTLAGVDLPRAQRRGACSQAVHADSSDACVAQCLSMKPTKSSSPSRSGSTRMSITVMRPLAMVKSIAERTAMPPDATAPGLPWPPAPRVRSESRTEPRRSRRRQRPARRSTRQVGLGRRRISSTTSGSSKASSASKSPPRAAARNASTTARRLAWFASGAGRVLAGRRPRLASWRAASAERPTIGCDLVERHGEHVVQDEREPLGRRERLEHDEQREARPSRRAPPPAPGRCVVSGVTTGVGTCVPCGSSRRALRVAQHVERHAGRRPLSATPLGSRAAGVGAAQPQPGFLHGVVRLVRETGIR